MISVKKPVLTDDWVKNRGPIKTKRIGIYLDMDRITKPRHWKSLAAISGPGADSAQEFAGDLVLAVLAVHVEGLSRRSSASTSRTGFRWTTS